MQHSVKNTAATGSKHRRREEDPINVVSFSNKQPLEATKRPKIPPQKSSPFSEFFMGKHRFRGPEIPRANGTHFDHSKIDRDGNSRKGFPSSSSSSSNHHLINLREWILCNKNSDVRKIDKLHLFRKIAEMVSAVHDREMALLDLRPSSFALTEKGDIKYVGRLMQVSDPGAKKKQKKTQQVDNGHESCFTNGRSSKPDVFLMDEKWYDCGEGLESGDLQAFNVYCLGILLVEFLCDFESIEARSTEMLDLRHRILPVDFLSKHPREAGFCFWLLHPEPSSRPKTRDILQCELMKGLGEITGSTSGDGGGGIEDVGGGVDDFESDLLLDFLDSLKGSKRKKVSHLLECIDSLEADIRELERRRDYSTQSSNDFTGIAAENRPLLLENMSQLETAYFGAKSAKRSGGEGSNRSDDDVLRRKPSDGFSSAASQGSFFDGFCKFARYGGFKARGALRSGGAGEIRKPDSVISSLSLDRDEEFVAAAGVSKKMKVFEVGSIMDGAAAVDVQYPVVQVTNEAKFSSICWNSYIRSYIVSADYDGLVQIWDVNKGKVIAKYEEHRKRAWSVDFFQPDPSKFASGGDDCSVRIWTVNEKNSTGCIWNQANVCCVQCSPSSSHFMAFGSADSKIYCYDLRHTRIPWCTLSGHDKAVSYVRFLDSETVVSSSVDGTLKLWDLKKTRLEGPSPDACGLTFKGHTNEKNFVGLAVLDGYIVCGSETNEVYAYYKSLPMPITRHKLGGGTDFEGTEEEEFVSSVCWMKNSEMVVAANSNGSIEILSLV